MNTILRLIYNCISNITNCGRTVEEDYPSSAFSLSISLESPSSGVFKSRRPSTSWTAAHLLRMSPAVSVFALPAATNSSFHDIVPASSVVGHSLLSARWPETVCLTISATQRLVVTSLKQHWRHTFSPSIRTCSALKASCVSALYKCTITYCKTRRIAIANIRARSRLPWSALIKLPVN